MTFSKRVQLPVHRLMLAKGHQYCNGSGENVRMLKAPLDQKSKEDDKPNELTSLLEFIIFASRPHDSGESICLWT